MLDTDILFHKNIKYTIETNIHINVFVKDEDDKVDDDDDGK